MLLKLCNMLQAQGDGILNDVLVPALQEPFTRLLENVGVSKDHNRDEYCSILYPILAGLEGSPVVYDALEDKHVDPYVGGILDSTPAVLESLRNSISIASLLGTLGGTVTFKRNAAVEAQEAKDVASFMRDIQMGDMMNEADMRA